MIIDKKTLSHHPFYPWLVLILLGVVCFLNYADRSILSAVFPLLEQEFHFSKFQLGLISSIFMWVYALMLFFSGYISDLYPRHWMIILGCFFWSLIAFLTGYCFLFWQFLLIRGLEGFGESFYFPAANSLLADVHGAKRRSTALSLHQSSIYLGTIVGSGLGGFLAEHYGWRLGFYIFGGIGMIFSFFLIFILQDSFFHKAKQEIKISFFSRVRLLFQKKEFIFILLAFCLVNAVAMTLLTWMPTFLYEKFSISLSKAAFYGVVFIQLSGAVTAPFIGLLADSVSKKRRHARVKIQLLGLLLGAIMLLFIGLSTSFSLVLWMMVFLGIGKTAYDSSVFATLFDYIPLELRGGAAGIVLSSGFLAGALGSFLVGFISTYGGAASNAIHRMGVTISYGSLAYVIAAVILLLVPIFFSPVLEKE